MQTLTVSEALRRIAVVKGLIGKHRGNAEKSVTHRKTESVAFDFGASVEKVGSLREELIALQTAVAVANASTTVPWQNRQIPVVRALKVLAELKSEISWLEGLKVLPGSDVVIREQHQVAYGQPVQVLEVPFTCHMPEAKRFELVEKLQADFAALNAFVEATNHKTTVAV